MDRELGHEQSEHLQLRAWLRLLTCANLVETRVRAGLRETFSITLPRFDVLSQLARAQKNGHPNGLTMGELSQRMMVSAGNVTGLVDGLVGDGLIVRHAQPGDRRSARVSLTPAGTRTFEAILPTHERWIDEAFSALDPGEIRRLLSLLAKLKVSAAGAKA
ncbi:MAG: MarR family transcriptional regulator [Alphaproteobacteria bacterium]|nr:MarR family transcriptional regulator [Alphaproteobacteria bacterium]